MSVYVGIDVHRKRSQVAVVTEDGTVQLNKNVVNGSEPMLRLIGDLFNVLNADTALVRNNNILSPGFNALAQNLSPRIFRVGVVVGF